MKFSHFKNPHCCSVHGCQLFSVISAKRNVFYTKCFQKYQIISVHPKYGVNLGRSNAIYTESLRFSYINPKFHLSFS